MVGFSKSSFSPDGLLCGADAVVSQQITLLSGQNLAKGAVLGKITASGKYTLSASAAGDGSQTPDAILAEATDASGGDKVTVAYVKAMVLESALVLGAGHTLDGIREGLRAKDIHLIKSQAIA